MVLQELISLVFYFATLHRGLFSSEEMVELKKCFDTESFQVDPKAKTLLTNIPLRILMLILMVMRNVQREVFTRGTGKDGGFQMALWWQPGLFVFLSFCQPAIIIANVIVQDITIEEIVQLKIVSILFWTVCSTDCDLVGDDTCGLVTRCRRLVDTLQLLLGGQQVSFCIFLV